MTEVEFMYGDLWVVASADVIEGDEDPGDLALQNFRMSLWDDEKTTRLGDPKPVELSEQPKDLRELIEQAAVDEIYEAYELERENG